MAVNSNASHGRSKDKRVKSFIILENICDAKMQQPTVESSMQISRSQTSSPIAPDPELRALCHSLLLQSNISYRIPFSNSHKNNTWIISFASTTFILHDFSKRLQYYSVRTNNIATSEFDFVISSHYDSNSFFLLPVTCIAS